jgi:hypothetical protein
MFCVCSKPCRSIVGFLVRQFYDCIDVFASVCVGVARSCGVALRRVNERYCGQESSIRYIVSEPLYCWMYLSDELEIMLTHREGHRARSTLHKSRMTKY